MHEPSKEKLTSELGTAIKTWDEIIAVISEKWAPIDQDWKPSKLTFGAVCLLKRKKRTLLYMIPEHGSFLAALVLGERAVVLALESSLPESIKTLIREARPYVEGRGIRFPVKTKADVMVVTDLVAIKMTPK